MIQSVTNATTLAKQLFDLASASKNADLLSLIADLRIELAELKGEVATLMTENTTLKQQLAKAAKKANLPELELRGDYLYDGEVGPYCPGCYDVSEQAIRLVRQHLPARMLGEFKCPCCRQFFGEGL